MPTIAIVGASRDTTKKGHQATKEYYAAGWNVIPVNPNSSVIAGITCVPRISGLTVAPDVISMYLPPVVGRLVLPDIQNFFPSSLVIFNPGSFDPDLIVQAKKLGLQFREMCSLVGLPKLSQEFMHQKQ